MVELREQILSERDLRAGAASSVGQHWLGYPRPSRQRRLSQPLPDVHKADLVGLPIHVA